ncbi:MAG: AMP-binding protein [Xanthomonadales bacterium]|nr:AMP-binding protein [Xanthomonadales bacterium]
MSPSDSPWLANYPPGVAHEVDVDQYPSIVAVLEEACTRYGDNPAYTQFDHSLTYAEINRLSRDFAAFLTGPLGLRRGDRVALMMPNVLQYPIAIFGVLRAGLTIVNTNPLYTARELRHQLADSGAKAILVMENFANTVEKVLPDTDIEHVIVTTIGEMVPGLKGRMVDFVVRHIKRLVPKHGLGQATRFGHTLAEGAKLPFEQPPIDNQEIAFLQYTGGTTGLAKGAMLSHRNMVANMVQVREWLGQSCTPGEEIIITALPLYHIFALTANCLVFMQMGGRNILILNPRDMKGFVKELKPWRFTVLTGVNTLFNGLLNTEGFDKLDFSGLHLSLGGGMAVQRPVATRWKQVTGCTLLEAYGLTETSPAACINPMDLADYNGSIGLPIPSTRATIRDEDGRDLASEEVGELCIQGPQVMVGYWQRPEETAEVLNADGWLRTGDMARMDERGYFFIVDRKKDMILVSGFNVYPNEVEDVVAGHPGVLEVAAIGIPDARSGEVVKLVVVRKDPNLDKQVLFDFCRENLTGYKRPREIEFRDELPKTNVGKILRRALRDEHIAANGG